MENRCTLSLSSYAIANYHISFFADLPLFADSTHLEMFVLLPISLNGKLAKHFTGTEVEDRWFISCSEPATAISIMSDAPVVRVG